jgi:hypothetical protein
MFRGLVEGYENMTQEPLEGFTPSLRERLAIGIDVKNNQTCPWCGEAMEEYVRPEGDPERRFWHQECWVQVALANTLECVYECGWFYLHQKRGSIDALRDHLVAVHARSRASLIGRENSMEDVQRKAAIQVRNERRAR